MLINIGVSLCGIYWIAIDDAQLLEDDEDLPGHAKMDIDLQEGTAVLFSALKIQSFY